MYEFASTTPFRCALVLKEVRPPLEGEGKGMVEFVHAWGFYLDVRGGGYWEGG